MESSIRAVHTASKRFADSIKTGSKSFQYATSTCKETDPVIPDENLCRVLSNASTISSTQEASLPSPAQCAIHLKFLECLFVLRQRVLKSEELDTLFDIKPEYRTVQRKGVNTKLKDETMWQRRQVKWDQFLDLAVVRFLVWWRKLRDIVELTEGDVKPEITADTVPPLGKPRAVVLDSGPLTD